MSIHGDFETRSATDIKKGLWRYTHDKHRAVLCFCYRLSEEAPVSRWRPGKANPQDLFDAVAAGEKFHAWNVLFEWYVWNYICVPDYGWPPLAIEDCVDTMAQAAAMNLPQSLAGCGEVLGLAPEQAKSKRGKYLIQRLCVPHPVTKTRASIWVDDADLMQELEDYCAQDVVAEAIIAKKLKPLSPVEQSVWLATQRINLRGLPVAVDEIGATVAMVDREKERLNSQLKAVTKYAVTSASQRQALLDWVNARTLEPLDDLTGETVQAALKRDDLSPQVRRALQIREAVCQTSTAKHETLLETVCPDGTVKGLLVYHGASTGRWASRGGLNAQNLPRPPLGAQDIESAHIVFSSCDYETASALFGDQLMDAAVSTVRGVIKAPEGYEFIDADWSSVENRVGSWIAGQQDKVDMFAKGLDEYRVFASKSLYGVPYDAVTKDQRQVSKSAVLGCMYGQGWKGLIEYAKGYGVTLTEERSRAVVDAYRSEYNKIASLWYRCAEAILDAVQHPGAIVDAGPYMKFAKMGNFLWLKLPSGRLICWYSPQAEMLETPWGEKRMGVTYIGADRFTGKWVRQKLIGSSAYQSGVQATARDLMAHALLALEEEGYPIVLLVHDEFLSLVPKGYGSEEAFMQIMCRPVPWAPGLPLAAEAWRGVRFRK